MRALAAAMLVAAPAAAPAQDARDLKVEALSARLFPLLSQLRGVEPRGALSSVLIGRKARAGACKSDPICTARASIWTDAEIDALARSAADLRLKGVPDDGAAKGLTRELRGLNSIIQVYALGGEPRYPTIDGPGELDKAESETRLLAATALRDTPRAGSAQRFDASIELALALLDAHDRTDATGFEPIDGGLNAAAMRRADGLDWTRYGYTAIILTGIGPETPDMPLSAGGKYHVRLAANRFAAGDAAFIIVSGGRAHPRATRFTEAVEMRRELIERHGVPADAIVIEPYARHTTTNLRNATRRLVAMGAPIDRDALIVCNARQSSYIERAEFAARNLRELGYQPGKIGARLSPTELRFRPSPASLRVDPLDPLDP